MSYHMKHSISDQTTKPSTGAGEIEGEDDWFSEDSDSHHSFDVQYQEKLAHREYISTSLVTGRNISMADVITEQVTKRMIEDREEIARNRCRFRRCLYGQEDPRAVLKDRRKKGMVFTMVGYDDITALCEKAKKLNEVHSCNERPAPSA